MGVSLTECLIRLSNPAPRDRRTGETGSAPGLSDDEEMSMTKSVLHMSMSLDGFIAGADDGPGNGLGTGGSRLHEWLGDPVSAHPHFAPSGLSGQVFAEVMATGAVVVGRKTFDFAGHWGGDHHGVPIFVPTRGTSPEPQSGWVHYVPDAATAMREAKAAAGDRDVMVHGAGLAQSLLREGLLDELEIHLIPVVLGDGRRLFGADRIELELTRVLDAPGVTHLRYRVVSSDSGPRLIVAAAESRWTASPGTSAPSVTPASTSS
jgi:dihydrofolate reductase